MTKMVGKTWGMGEVNLWTSENWSGRVHFEGHSPEWRVLSKLSVQPCLLGSKFSQVISSLTKICVITISSLGQIDISLNSANG